MLEHVGIVFSKNFAFAFHTYRTPIEIARCWILGSALGEEEDKMTRSFSGEHNYFAEASGWLTAADDSKQDMAQLNLRLQCSCIIVLQCVVAQFYNVLYKLYKYI